MAGSLAMLAIPTGSKKEKCSSIFPRQNVVRPTPLSPVLPLFNTSSSLLGPRVMLKQSIRSRELLPATPAPSTLQDTSTDESLVLMFRLLMPTTFVLLLESLSASMEGTREWSLVSMGSEMVVS